MAVVVGGCSGGSHTVPPTQRASGSAPNGALRHVRAAAGSFTITDALGQGGDQAAFTASVAGDPDFAAAVATADAAAVATDPRLVQVLHAAGLQLPSQLNPNFIYALDTSTGQLSLLDPTTAPIEVVDNGDGTTSAVADVPTPAPTATPDPGIVGGIDGGGGVGPPGNPGPNGIKSVGGQPPVSNSVVWGIEANWWIDAPQGDFVAGHAQTVTYCFSFFFWDRWCGAANAGVTYGRGSARPFDSSSTGRFKATATANTSVLNVGHGLYKLDGYEGFFATWMYFVRHNYHEERK